jgi:hypothetical protein
VPASSLLPSPTPGRASSLRVSSPAGEPRQSLQPHPPPRSRALMIAKDLRSARTVRNRRDITRRVSARKAHAPPVTPVTESDIVGQNTPYTGGKGPR